MIGALPPVAAGSTTSPMALAWWKLRSVTAPSDGALSAVTATSKVSVAVLAGVALSVTV